MNNHYFTTYVSIKQKKIVYTFEASFVDITLRTHSTVIKQKQVCQETWFVKQWDLTATPLPSLFIPALPPPQALFSQGVEACSFSSHWCNSINLQAIAKTWSSETYGVWVLCLPAEDTRSKKPTVWEGDYQEFASEKHWQWDSTGRVWHLKLTMVCEVPRCEQHAQTLVVSSGKSGSSSAPQSHILVPPETLKGSQDTHTGLAEVMWGLWKISACWWEKVHNTRII